MSESSHPPMDYPEHEKTYRNFVRLVIWSCGASAVALILMAIFLL